MEEDLRALLLADPGVAAIAGSRVTWRVRPQGSALPAVVLHLVGGTKSYTLNGESGPFAPRVQVNSLASDYLAALELSRAVVAALSGFAGVFGSTYFLGILQDSEPTDLDQPGGATAENILGITADFIANHHPQE